MNHNPDLNDLENWLSFWNERSLRHMERHREHKANQFNKVVDPEQMKTISVEERNKIWDLLSNRNNIILSFPALPVLGAKVI